MLKFQQVDTGHYSLRMNNQNHKKVFLLTFIKSEGDQNESRIQKLIQSNEAQIFKIDYQDNSLEDYINQNLKNNAEIQMVYYRKLEEMKNRV
jgi:hypothetical protein